jgi:elongation factor P
MQKEAGDFREGNVIKIGNDLWVVMKAIYHNPGRHAAMSRLKLRNLTTGQVAENAYKSDNKLDFVILDRKQMQFVFKSDDVYTFMDQESYEQYEIRTPILGDAVHFLKEELIIDVMLHEEHPVSVELPIIVELKIEYTEPAVRGDTSGKVMKTAKLETGHEISVPSYCLTGEMIRIDTRSGEYVDRVK